MAAGPVERQTKVFTGLTGRDRSLSAEIGIPDSRAYEMMNVDLYETTFARKRNGCVAAFGETTGEAFTGVLSALFRHVPGADETAAELWGVDNAATPVVQRLAGGTAWSSPTLKDNLTAADVANATAVSFNGKLHIFYNSAQDRSHVWDGSTVRRSGFATPAAPTVANTGAGAYAATLRYYRMRYTEVSGSTIVRRSEPSASVSFTPSGAGTAARITKAAAITEGETHWEIEISIDNSVWWKLTSVVVGTTTYDDSSDPLNASAGTAAPLDGAYTAFTSYKYGLVDDNRLLLAGQWETTANSSRVWFTPRQGTTDEGDDERIVDTLTQENWVTLDEKDGGAITGMAGPIQGMPVIFKYRQLWKLRPTGEVDAPYQPLAISKKVGSLRHQANVMAEDENGDPALYFPDPAVGFYRLGNQGLQFCGRDVRDLWKRINKTATVPIHGVYHKDKHQIWWFLALDSATTPNTVVVFDTTQGEADEDDNVRGGWTVFDGIIAKAKCSVMFADTLGASMSLTLKPYMGYTTGSVLLRGDDGLLDNTSAYASYVTLAERHLAGLANKCEVDQVIVLGAAGPHTLQLTITRDYGAETRTSHVTMTEETGDQTRVQHVFEAAYMADAKSVKFKIGDLCPIALGWDIDAIAVQFEQRESISG